MTDLESPLPKKWARVKRAALFVGKAVALLVTVKVLEDWTGRALRELILDVRRWRTMMLRVLRWIGKACNHLHWCRHYFIWPPDENNAEEMRLYNERLKW